MKVKVLEHATSIFWRYKSWRKVVIAVFLEVGIDLYAAITAGMREVRVNGSSCYRKGSLLFCRLNSRREVSRIDCRPTGGGGHEAREFIDTSSLLWDDARAFNN
jgi:hypothetical protein